MEVRPMPQTQELAKIVISDERMHEILPKVFDLLNPDDWHYLETVLQYTGQNIADISLCFNHQGAYSVPHRFEPSRFSISLNCKDPSQVFEIFSGKLPEKVYIREGGFLQVCELTNQFLDLGYELVCLKARSGSDYHMLPGIELKMGLPNFGFHHPTISIVSRAFDGEDFSPAAKKTLDLLRSCGYRV